MVDIPSFSAHPNLLPSKPSLIPSEYSISMENQPPTSHNLPNNLEENPPDNFQNQPPNNFQNQSPNNFINLCPIDPSNYLFFTVVTIQESC
jgi:hypothetical protein